ncbi:putative HTH-type transcriptional regulator pcaQ (plasmid) [Phaeobacter inhibens]|uniref:HTH-type transcriptional regulator pcaQ n=1 Tax=Phaeobacter inhibens TaxID=221822 RepID=A0ABM6RKN2_9RHOB|nr:pca operon transcription factor PcaQ [Phaeobacter inhibens]AUQ52473.1 putative HTH-type transcriptional regulator pcaQ [Phaeobacter inhibens]AUQ97078.1 putative HTH-type transcriptional regulator pcaQ [Phaeobacter inhibens]AUR22278.1 putative HTH-type transcriptional regulator pcaQ [Phaeobacter inhibens]
MIDRRIKFRHIQCLVEICRQKSLKQAAEKLFLTQPAISKTLKELEEILGADLLIRNRAGVVLTKEGEVFLHFAEMSLASLQQGMAGVEQIGAQGKTKLTVGALPSVAASIMPDVALELAEIAPNTQLEIVAGSHSGLIDQLRVGALDLVIGRLGRPGLMQGISFTQLYEEKVIFVVRAGHPLLNAPDLSRIGDWQVIYPPKDAAIHPLVERFLIAHGVGKLPNRLETVSGAFARVYVPKSDAVWIISAGVIANELQNGHLVELPFDTHVTRGPVGLMRRPQEIPSSQEQVFQIAVDRVIRAQGLNSPAK